MRKNLKNIPVHCIIYFLESGEEKWLELLCKIYHSDAILYFKDLHESVV